MTAIEVLNEIRAASGRLTPSGDKLRWALPPRGLSDAPIESGAKVN